jgi:hypothetical protein
MANRMIVAHLSATSSVTKLYPDDHPIWKLDPAKQERQAVADIQRDIIRLSGF